LLKRSGRTRQLKLIELTGLAHAAFEGMAERTLPVEGEPDAEIVKMLGDSFVVAAKALADPSLKSAMQQAADFVGSGKFAEAVGPQEQAGEKLLKIFMDLKAVQDAIAIKGIEIAKKEESNAEEQKRIKELESGSDEDLLNEPDNLKL